MSLSPSTIFSLSARQHIQALFKLNMLLEAAELPRFYLGDRSFNPEYRLYPAPRWAFRFGFPPVAIAEIYLTYRPEHEDQIDLVYSHQNGSLHSVKVRDGSHAIAHL